MKTYFLTALAALQLAFLPKSLFAKNQPDTGSAGGLQAVANVPKYDHADIKTDHTNELTRGESNMINSSAEYSLFLLALAASAASYFAWKKQGEAREAFKKLAQKETELNEVTEQLEKTEELLRQAEKMASLGELTAGIAHEIQNPLNFVNNFAEVNVELIDDIKNELNAGNSDEVHALTDDLKENNEKIAHHGKRADNIVQGMLKHSRNPNGEREPTDVNAIAEQFLKLAYHGLRAKDKSFNATINSSFDNSIEPINAVSQDIGRVVLNLMTNAMYSINEKARQKKNGDYTPTISVHTKKENDKVYISVEDNGNGVPKTVIDKIFQPFFTTKPSGLGTGLGLSLSYDIIQQHGGNIFVESNEGEGARFVIELPLND